MLRQKKLNPFLAFLAMASLVLALACGADEELAAAEARSEEWGALQQDRDNLFEKRAEQMDLAARVAAAGAVVAEGEEALTEEARAELANQLLAVDNEIETLTTNLGSRVVNFINDGQMDRGAEPTEMQLAAFRMKAGEDLLVADEYGEKGGDWAKAIGIAEVAEQLDPTNPEVLARLEHYRAMRYITEERLALAQRGMTLDEVKAVLGVPSRGNDKKHSDTRRALYYMKSPARDAAAVYFEMKRGEWIAYKVDFNAIAGNEE